MDQACFRAQKWPFAARSASPCRSARGRSGTPSPRFVCFSQVDSHRRQRFAIVCSCSFILGKRETASPTRAPAMETPAAIGQSRNRANYLWGLGAQFRHEYPRLAAHRREENSSPTPTNSHLVLLIAQNIARPPQALLGHPGRSAELLSETHHSRSALEYGDTAMSASARVTECLNEDRG